MPELPEVETIRRGLEGRVEQLEILGIEASGCRIFQIDPAKLAAALEGECFTGLERLGKFLIFRLKERTLVVHLGMTGQLTLREPAVADADGFLRHPVTGLQRIRQHAPDRHTHFQIHFENGSSLLYRDIRMFGKVYLLAPVEAARDRFFARLGLEPFSEEYRLDAFLDRFRGRTLAIKSLLLDQRFVAGVGNIYADEALFEASIHPLRRVTTLRRYEKERLFQTIKGVLEKGIHFGGTSMRDYINSDGETGSFQEELLVYGRRGEECFLCGTEIEKIVVSQRGTHFCPTCQSRSRPVGGRGLSPARHAT